MSKVKDPLIDNKDFYTFETNFLHYFGWITKITVVLFLVGFFQQKPTIFINFNFIVKICLALFLIYRLAVLFGSQLRMHLLRTEARLASGNEVELVADKCQIGDWFVLLLLGKNINPFVFKEIICDLASRFVGKKDVD